MTTTNRIPATNLEWSNGEERWMSASENPSSPGEACPEPEEFLIQAAPLQTATLVSMRCDEKEHGKFIHRCLQIIRKLESRGGAHLGIALDGMRQLCRTRSLLERELLEQWLDTGSAWCVGRDDALDRLETLMLHNSCLDHPLVEAVGGDLDREPLGVILRLLSTHREVMELEQSLILIGLHGRMGRLVGPRETRENGEAFPTSSLDAWKLLRMPRTPLLRRWDEPWFCKVVREAFLMSASRPGWKFRAYGSLMVKESWSCPHLDQLLAGMERNGLLSRKRALRILTQVESSRGRAPAMMEAIRAQRPNLGLEELEEILLGARLAVSLAHKLFDLGWDMLREGCPKEDFRLRFETM